MKEIVVISGKGGTGKTSICASFAMLGGTDAVVADCDVDAADMHLLLQPDFGETQDFYSGVLTKIDQDRCNRCGACRDVCRFDAIEIRDDRYAIDPLSCESCGYCSRVCPTGAVVNFPRHAGKWYISRIKTGAVMVHGERRWKDHV